MPNPGSPPVADAVFDYVLVGGGLQNGLIALAVLAARPESRIALVEQSTTLGGNHLWCFHQGDLGPSARSWSAPLVVHQWSGYRVRFPGRERTVDEGYFAVTSERFDRVVRGTLADHRAALHLGRAAVRIAPRSVTLDDGTELTGRVVVDARGPGQLASLAPVAYQKFVGCELELDADHDIDRPLLMDACVPQTDGFRFFYVLPFSARQVFVEDTYYADSPDLDVSALRAGILAHAEALGLRVARVTREEIGVLPLPSRADFGPQSAGVLRGGYQGGWFHPTTGYSFPVAARLAEFLATRPPEGTEGADLDRLIGEQRRQIRYAMWLNRLLFGAFRPQDRYHVLERFYGLPADTIRRFYALETTLADRTRIVCGRPPRGISLTRLSEGRFWT